MLLIFILFGFKNIEPANPVRSCKKMNGMKKIQVVSRNDASKKGLLKNVLFALRVLFTIQIFCYGCVSCKTLFGCLKKQPNLESLMGLKLHHITNEPDCLEEVVFQR